MPAEASFGPWMRQRRKALDLTEEALAERVGCAGSQIRRVETDRMRPSRELAERLAEVLQIPPEERSRFLSAARSARPTRGAASGSRGRDAGRLAPLAVEDQ